MNEPDWPPPNEHYDSTSDFSEVDFEENNLQSSQPVITHGSLFPAYGISQNSKSEAQTLDWLTNSSFTVTAAVAVEKINNDAEKHKAEPIQEPEVLKTDKKRKLDKKENKRLIKEHEKRVEESVYTQLAKKTFIEETGLAIERAFRLDSKPDYDNFSFDSFYKLQLARYRSLGLCPLGIPDKEQKLWVEILQKSLKKKKRKKEIEQRYFHSKSLSQVKQNTMPNNYAKQKTLKVNEIFGYIPLSLSFNETENKSSDPFESVNPLGVYDNATAAYTAGVAKITTPTVELLTQTSSESSLYKKTEWFNKTLREKPGDEKLWLDFVQYQDELVISDPYGNDKKIGEINDKIVLEKKLSIFDKAVANNPRSINLAIERLGICLQLWEFTKVAAEWKKLTFLHAGDPDVWNYYLRFLQSNLTSFTVPSLVKTFIKAISKLNSVLQGTFNVISVSKNLEEKLIDFFSDLCKFLWDSGFTERAIATFQAMIEFNFFAPPLPTNTSLEDRVAFFEPFWDSGVPRIGEKGARGWANIMATKIISDISTVSCNDLNDEEDSIIEQKLDRNNTWIQFESLREANHWLPWRPRTSNTDDEFQGPDECEDPERMVMVDDIVSILFRLTSENAKMSLVWHFFEFLGVSTSTKDKQITDLLNGEFDRLIRMLSSNSYDGKRVKLPNKFEMANKTEFICQVFNQIRNEVSIENKKLIDKAHVRFNIESKLRNVFFGSKMFVSEVKTLKKFVRQLLQDESNRNNLELWIEYARLEWITGKHKEAFNIYDTILLNRVRTKTTELELFYFVYKIVQIVFGIDRFSQSLGFKSKNINEVLKVYKPKLLRYLVHLGSGDSFKELPNDEIPPVLILKAKNAFEAILDTSYCIINDLENNDRKDTSFFSISVTCAAYFHCILNNYETGIDVFENILNKKDQITISAIDQEFLFDARIQLLMAYSVSISSLRPVLEKAISLNPLNITHLRLLMNIDGASYLSRRLRNFFTKLLGSPSTKKEPVIWLLAILSEWDRLLRISSNEILEEQNVEIPQIGIAWKIRSLFDRALSVSPVMYSPTLWRMYMKFEIDQGQPSKAKSVFYKSLQKCPGHKLLYMDSVLYFPSDFEESINLMMEKELRVRTPTEEIDLLLAHEHKVNTEDSASFKKDQEIIIID